MALCHAISKLSAKSIGSRQSKYLIAAADNVNRTSCFVVPLNPDTEHTLAGCDRQAAARYSTSIQPSNQIKEGK